MKGTKGKIELGTKVTGFVLSTLLARMFGKSRVSIKAKMRRKGLNFRDVDDVIFYIKSNSVT